ncbi:porin family protein [Litorimonas sp.]|uniref:porin family protein n=1 Tax=Litorimonas sp. TaxID=1892381 RepID=UPI003A868116
MRKLTTSALAGSMALSMAFFASAGVAQAQDSGAYGTLGASTYEFDTYNATGRLGYNFNRYFGVEGEGSIGVIGEEENGVETDTEWDLGAYAVGRLPITERVEAFARAGYTVVSVETETAGVKFQDEADGYAVGGGLQYNMDSRNGIRAGYTYKDGEIGGVDIDADVWDIAYVRKF